MGSRGPLATTECLWLSKTAGAGKYAVTSRKPWHPPLSLRPLWETQSMCGAVTQTKTLCGEHLQSRVFCEEAGIASHGHVLPEGVQHLLACNHGRVGWAHRRLVDHGSRSRSGAQRCDFRLQDGPNTAHEHNLAPQISMFVHPKGRRASCCLYSVGMCKELLVACLCWFKRFPSRSLLVQELSTKDGRDCADDLGAALGGHMLVWNRMRMWDTAIVVLSRCQCVLCWTASSEHAV